jgi:predicted CoA-binding protein
VTYWQSNIVTETEAIHEILECSRRIAILGIKPESRSHKPAHSVPRLLRAVGFEIIPVLSYYQNVKTILGEKVYRSVAAIPGHVDLADVFRRPEDIPAHLPDIMIKAPTTVWFQKGIRNDEAARQLAMAGIRVVQDRYTAMELRRMKRRHMSQKWA